MSRLVIEGGFYAAVIVTVGEIVHTGSLLLAGSLLVARSYMIVGREGAFVTWLVGGGKGKAKGKEERKN